MDVRLVADRYRLEHRLGQGGMGTVWLGEDQLAGRQVAVKELRPPQGLPGTDQENFTRRALQEARSAARIQHANAVTLFDVIPATADDDAVYLIMEYVHGRTLADVITENGPVGDEYAKAIGLQLLSILEAAHALGVVHRDIKPANIMITAAGEAKLTDFGIAYSMGETRLTRGGVMGTQSYMAPELFESAPITPAVDLWSLGATLYYAVESRGPFDRDTTAATLHAILVEDLPAPSCAAEIAAAIGGLLPRDPARRFSIAQARSALLGELPDQPVSTATTTHPGPGPAAPASPPPSPSSSFPPPEPSAPRGRVVPAQPSMSGTGGVTSAIGPSATALRREHAPAPAVAGDQETTPPREKPRLGTRRAAAAAVLGLGTVLTLVSLFLPIYGKTPLTADARWLWPSLLYLVSWAAATAWMLVARVRPRPGALFGLGLGVPAIGLALQNLAEITYVWPTPGSSFTVGLIGVLAGIAGAVCALTIAAARALADVPDAEDTPAWRKALPAAGGLAAIVWYSVFPWLQGSPSAFQTFGRSSLNAAGVIIPILVFAAITAASVRSTAARERAALLAGAVVYLLALALQDVVTVAALQFREPLTVFFWLYVILAALIAFACGWMTRSPRETM